MSKILVQHNAASLALGESPVYLGEPVGEHLEQTAEILMKDPDGKFVTGVWECVPGTLKLDMPAYESCYVLKGVWELTSDEGEVHLLGPGDNFLFPKGWKGTSVIKETVRKVFTVIT